MVSGVLALVSSPGLAAEDAPSHALAMHGRPALGPDQPLPYANPSAPAGGRLVMGEVGGFDSLHPYILRGRAPWILRTHTVESLMARSWDEPFTLYGLLAERVETPPDRASVTFTLRREARFSDGSPVTLDDVIWSFETLGRQGHPRYRAAWEAISEIEPVGPRTVRISFAEPNRELPLIMGLRPILKKAAWQARAFSEPSLEPVIGSGPYMPVDWEPGRQLTLRRNPDWWGRDLPLMAGLYNFDEIRIEYYRNSDALWSAVRGGEVSLFVDGDPVRWAEGYDFPAVRAGRLLRHEISHGRPSGMEGFVFNTRRASFSDRQVRVALALAFDWTWVNERLFAGQMRRAESYWSGSDLAFSGPAEGLEAELLAPFADQLPEGTLQEGWRPPAGDGGRNRRALRRAGQLLEAAGWRLVDGQRRRDGMPLSFEILVRSSEHETLASLWKSSLARLGVAVTVRRVDDAQYEARRQSYDYDVIVNRWWLSLSPGTEQWLYFGSAGRERLGTRNYMGAAAPAIDAMIRALLAAETRAPFAAAVRALDRVLSSEVYVVPFGVLAQDRIAASADLRRPDRDPLYGFRSEVWWRDSARPVDE
ncbi:MAG: extracellular solute-binding protein [Pikeienuella sp.]